MVIRSVLAVESVETQNSGIGRVARLMKRVFQERCSDQKGGSLYTVVLNDGRARTDINASISQCHGSRLRFVTEIQGRGLLARQFAYDSLSMARAHTMGPACLKQSLAWMHGIEVWENARNVHLRTARRVSLLITNSEYTKCRAEKLHPAIARARVCWLGTETDDPAGPAFGPDHPPTVLLLARIDQESYKGHEELVQSWPDVLRQVPKARLLIAGDGPGFMGLHRKIAQSPGARNIELAGFITEEKIPALWNETDVFAMPSRGEGFGLVYIEAMRYGKPVIASRQDAGKEINVHGETGYNVDLDRPSDLVEALVRLLLDRTQAQSMGGAGQERWRRHFSWSAFRTRFTKLIEQEGF